MERIVERERVRVRARAGYTLVEMMMIVMIIGVSVLAFTPGFSRAMADRRISLATRELIRIGRRARADTFGYLRAHLLWIDPVGRQIVLLRGPTNSCSLTDWGNVATDCTTDGTASAQRCVENVLLSSMSGSGRTISIWEESTNGSSTDYDATRRAICFQPSGVNMYATGNTVAAARSALAVDSGAGGGFVFSLVAGTAKPGTSVDQRVHRVLFPMGGSARSLR